MANIAINEKSTKTELMSFLRSTYKEVAKLDKTLADSIKYANDQFKKDPKPVIRGDLWDLAQQVMQVTGTITKPVELSSKLGNKSIPLASIFPPDLEINEHKFVAVPFKYQTMDEIRKAVKEDEKDLMFVTYWTSRLIRQFDYVNMFGLEKRTNEDVIKEFQNDLDIMTVKIVLNEEDIIIAVSAYTEAICLFKGEDLKAVEDTDSDGNKYVLRFSNGMEFQIYELVDDDTDNEASEKTEEAKESLEKTEDNDRQQDKQEEIKEEKKAHKPKIKKTKTEPKKDDSVQMTLNDGETPDNNKSGNTVTE